MNLILWLVVSSWANPTGGLTAEQLQESLKKYQGLERLEVDFKQTKHFKDMDVKIESQGHLSVRPPGHVVWEVRKPAPVKLELTPETLDKIPPAHRREMQALIDWLKLDAKAIHERFFVYPMKDVFEFQSRDPNSLFTRIFMDLNRAGHVDKLQFVEKSGDQIDFHFSKPVVKYLVKKK